MVTNRDDHALRDLLLELNRMIPIKDVEAWTFDEYRAAEEWAAEQKLHPDAPFPLEPDHVRRYA